MGRPRAFTPEQELEVCEEYERLERAKPIADKYGVNPQTIYRVLKKHDIPRTHRHPKLKESGIGSGHKGIDANAVCEMYKSGHSVPSIASKFDCSSSTVYHHLEKAGLYKMGERKAKIDALMPKVVELHNQGMSDYKIAEALGIGHYAVNKRLRKMGIERGKGSNSRNGGIAYGKKAAEYARKKAHKRFETVSDVVELIEYIDKDHARVRCVKCGTEFNWDRRRWKMDTPCPSCNYQKKCDEQERERDRKKYEREQQRIAAREWLLSVPRICKECGCVFYSEYETACYCTNGCRHRAKVRRNRNNARTRQNGHGRNRYKRRMRIKVTKHTYDRTVTLDAVYKKYRGRCCECGCHTVRTKEYSPQRATLDHVIALNNNGTHTWDNVQLLCADCNSKKRDLGQMRLAIA